MMTLSYQAFIVDNDDENLREIYVTNIDHIQADHQRLNLRISTIFQQ